MNLSRLVLIVSIPITSLCIGELSFETTISKAFAEADVQQKDLFLYFTSADCSRCKTLDKYFDNQVVQEAMRRKFVSAKVDINDFDGRACSEIYQVQDVPALLVVTPTGQVVHKQTGELDVSAMDELISGNSGYLVQHTVQKVPEPREEVAPEEVSSVTPAGKYSIQIGFFSSKTNANNMAKLAASKGFSETRIQEESRNNTTFYRVLVSNFATEREAEKVRELIATSGLDAKLHLHTP